MSGTDRRASPRATLRGEAIVYVGSERVACRAMDVGEGGMALASPVGRAPGQFLRVNFHLNGGSRMLDADAVLVRDSTHENEHVWGVMFQKLDPVMMRWITEYVEKGVEPGAMHVPGEASQPRRPTPAGNTPAASGAEAQPGEGSRSAAAHDVATRPAKAPSPAAQNVEPPPPARLSARRARYEEPPPPARVTAAPRSAAAQEKRKSAKERHIERMEAYRSQRELAELYREAVKNLRAEHGKKKR